MGKDEFKQARRKRAAKHGPPLIHLSDAAEVLGMSVGAANWHLKSKGLKTYYLPKPFSRGTYYEKAAIEELADNRAQQRMSPRLT